MNRNPSDGSERKTLGMCRDSDAGTPLACWWGDWKTYSVYITFLHHGFIRLRPRFIIQKWVHRGRRQLWLLLLKERIPIREFSSVIVTALLPSSFAWLNPFGFLLSGSLIAINLQITEKPRKHKGTSRHLLVKLRIPNRLDWWRAPPQPCQPSTIGVHCSVLSSQVSTGKPQRKGLERRGLGTDSSVPAGHKGVSRKWGGLSTHVYPPHPSKPPASFQLPGTVKVARNQNRSLFCTVLDSRKGKYSPWPVHAPTAVIWLSFKPLTTGSLLKKCWHNP